MSDTLYFTATDDITGYELWESDGTSKGTVLVNDINPSPYFSYIDVLTNVNVHL